MEIGIDQVRNYWDSRPCNIRHSAAPIGTRQYFEEITERKYFVEPHIPGFAQFDKWSKKTVLEIGCGIGTDAVSFAKMGAEYTGIELSAESLQLAQKRFELFGLEGKFVLGDAEELNIEEFKTYDLIYSFGVLHHTPDIQKALRNIRKLSHKNSQIKIMLYAKNSWKQKMIDGGLDQPEAQFGCPIANSYSKEEVEAMMTDSGFEVTSIRQDHIFPYVVQDYKEYKYVREPWFQEMPPKMFSILEKNFGWHLLIDAVPSESATG